MIPVPFQEDLSLFLVVVEGDDVGYRMLPAVIDDHRAHGIQAFGQVIDGFREGLLSFAGSDPGNSPGFIEGSPGDDGGMAVVLSDDLQPFPGKLGKGQIRKLVKGRHLAPDQQSLHVTPVQEPLILDLHVLAHPVVAHGLDLVDVVHQGLFIRGCEMGILPVSLVQKQSLVEGTAV